MSRTFGGLSGTGFRPDIVCFPADFVNFSRCVRFLAASYSRTESRMSGTMSGTFVRTARSSTRSASWSLVRVVASRSAMMTSVVRLIQALSVLASRRRLSWTRVGWPVGYDSHAMIWRWLASRSFLQRRRGLRGLSMTQLFHSPSLVSTLNIGCAFAQEFQFLIFSARSIRPISYISLQRPLKQIL